MPFRFITKSIHTYLITVTLGRGMSFEDGMKLEVETATALADTSNSAEGIDAFS